MYHESSTVNDCTLKMLRFHGNRRCCPLQHTYAQTIAYTHNNTHTQTVPWARTHLGEGVGPSASVAARWRWERGDAKQEQIKAHRGKLAPLALFLCNSCTFSSLHLTSWHIRPAGRSARQSRAGREREGGWGARSPRLKQNRCMTSCCYSLLGEAGHESHILLREQPKITKEG